MAENTAGLNYKKVFKDREKRLQIINKLRFIPDKPYLKFVYRVKTGKKLNLKNPIGFNEKLNWLKLNDRKPEYTKLVDKYEVRDYIARTIGEEFLFPCLGVWDSFDKIDFTSLPEQFVLKCTHDSGSVKIIRDKSSADFAELKVFFENRMKINPFAAGREYPYKDVKPRIIAEKLMCGENGELPQDYKFFCFNGNPEVMFVATDREREVTHTLFDMDFNKLPIHYIHESVDGLEKPKTFEGMKSLCKDLSNGMRFVRIDLYEVNGRIYFGEFTFFPAGGFYLMNPPEWEKRFGDLLKIDN